ncbi:DNA-3-methyladenine glycosylase family protein [Cohnella suwonensis]|uniref:DNA-3-methyladenine glycosylase II n=1 Tax=Cohnella suwonensis TaxID=696072 RepID=A0ABW0LYI2_9BACL
MQYLFDLHPNDDRVRELGRNDTALNKLIHRIEHVRIPVQQDGYIYLVRSLVAQQLSAKAAETIFLRFERLCGNVTPDAILTTSEEDMRSVGLSKNKSSYIRNVAEHVKEGALDFRKFSDMDDEEVVRLLTSLKGIGRWTAEMFLIFYLGRQDVLSYGDIGLQRAAEWLYASEESGGQPLLHRKQACWKPYSTIASLYLWEAINLGLVRTERI